MKKTTKIIIVLLIAAMGYLTVAGVTTVYGDSTTRAIKGIDDVRWGIDIRGGVDVTFSPPEGVTATAEEMDAAESIIQVRLVSQNITDTEIYTDHDKNRIIVRFPWKADETEFNPEQAIAELGAMANLTFREGANIGPDGKPAGDTLNKPVLEGKDIESATAVYSTASSAAQGRLLSPLSPRPRPLRPPARQRMRRAKFPKGIIKKPFRASKGSRCPLSLSARRPLRLRTHHIARGWTISMLSP